MPTGDLLAVLGVAAVVLGVVGLWLGLDRLASRWFQALPEDIKRHGLIGLVWRRLRRSGGRTGGTE
jgi:hypothetical protein